MVALHKRRAKMNTFDIRLGTYKLSNCPPLLKEGSEEKFESRVGHCIFMVKVTQKCLFLVTCVGFHQGCIEPPK